MRSDNYDDRNVTALNSGFRRADPAQELLTRIYHAFIEARMRAAMHEIARRRHLIPEELLKKAGYTATVSDDAAYPFTR